MLTIILLGVLASPAIAAIDAVRPLPEEGPTEVMVSIFVLDIDEVNTAAQNFDANVYFRVSWRDPRLAHDGTSEITRSSARGLESTYPVSQPAEGLENFP